MSGANLGRTETAPFRIEPEFGKIGEDDIESSINEVWAVFNERESRSYLANDAGHVFPQPASFSADSGTFTGPADVLAGKAARYDIDTSAPRLSVKSPHVIPNWERWQTSVVLSGDQYACGISVVLNCRKRSPSEQVGRKNASTSARENSQLIHRSLLVRF